MANGCRGLHSAERQGQGPSGVGLGPGLDQSAQGGMGLAQKRANNKRKRRQNQHHASSKHFSSSVIVAVCVRAGLSKQRQQAAKPTTVTQTIIRRKNAPRTRPQAACLLKGLREYEGRGILNDLMNSSSSSLVRVSSGSANRVMPTKPARCGRKERAWAPLWLTNGQATPKDSPTWNSPMIQGYKHHAAERKGHLAKRKGPGDKLREIRETMVVPYLFKVSVGRVICVFASCLVKCHHRSAARNCSHQAVGRYYQESTITLRASKKKSPFFRRPRAEA